MSKQGIFDAGTFSIEWRVTALRDLKAGDLYVAGDKSEDFGDEYAEDRAKAAGYAVNGLIALHDWGTGPDKADEERVGGLRITILKVARNG